MNTENENCDDVESVRFDDLEKYQAIIFDMDGTLIDSMPSHALAWQQTCAFFNCPYDKQYLWNLGGVPTEQIVARLNEKYQLQLDPNEVAEKKRAFFTEMTAKMNRPHPLIAVTHEIFQHYYGKKPIAVGTGGNRQQAEQLLGAHQLLDKLSTLVTANDVNQPKPAPETFLRAAEQMGVAAKHCVVFEDTHIGYQAATAAGMACILVKEGKLVLAAD